MKELKPDRELYRDSHRGIGVEVSRHWMQMSPNYREEVWCYYLFLAVECFPKEFHEDLTRPVQVSEYGSRFQPYAECLEKLDSWHGGMTFYELRSSTDEPLRSIKVGCDYHHLWDENKHYDAEVVMRYAKATVDELFERFPTLKTPQQLWDEYHAPFNERMALDLKNASQEKKG